MPPDLIVYGARLVVPPSIGVTTSAGSSGTTTSPSTNRPPGRSWAATRANRSALPAALEVVYGER